MIINISFLYQIRFYGKCVLTVICYTIYQVCIRYNELYSSSSLCRTDLNYNMLAWSTNTAQAGGFFLSLCLLILKYFRDLSINHTGCLNSLLIAITTLLLVFLTSMLTLIWNWGGICEDALG